MEGNRRTGRVTDGSTPGQRTLDPEPTPPAEPPVSIDPSEVLEAPPAQRASVRLEERQTRWLRQREAAEASAKEKAEAVASSAENAPADPKG